MLTIDDLNLAAAAATRRQSCSQVAALLWMPLAGALGWWARAPAEAFALRWADEVTARFALIATLGAVMGVPAILVVVLGSFRNEHLDRADRRLACPCCGGSLRAMRSLVVATRCCGHCGKKILHADDRAEPDDLA